MKTQENNTKVFVTGANGMLGSSICRELIKQNYTIKAMCMTNTSTATINDLRIEIVFGNILDRSFLLKEMKGCDYVIHVAASTQVWPRRCKKIHDINVTGTKNIMELAHALDLKRMIHIGTASSFKPGTRNEPGQEDTEYVGWKYGMDYIDSKFLAQKILLEHHVKTDFPVIVINPTFMIGPFDSGPSSGKMLIGLSKGTIPGYCSGGKNFVCSNDVAIATVNALTRGRPGQCYIAGHQNLDYKYFFETAAATMNKPITLKPIPRLAILLVGAINSTIARITNKSPKLSYGMAKLASAQHYYSSNKAVRELNMPQTPIEKGIEQCMNWFHSNGHLK